MINFSSMKNGMNEAPARPPAPSAIDAASNSAK
jgi:hypothetical protein